MPTFSPPVAPQVTPRSLASLFFMFERSAIPPSDKPFAAPDFLNNIEIYNGRVSDIMFAVEKLEILRGQKEVEAAGVGAAAGAARAERALFKWETELLDGLGSDDEEDDGTEVKLAAALPKPDTAVKFW
jgi:hypothetical protein